MKLSDIFSLNLNSKGGAKLFKKIANKYNLDYKEARKSVEDNTNKYGYYVLNKDIIPDDFTIEDLCSILSELLKLVNYIELNGITGFDKISGVCGFVNADASYAIRLFQQSLLEFPHITKNEFNLGFKICENDINYVSVNNHRFYIDIISGTITGRMNECTTIIPITKEEYEHLSDDLRNIE